MNQQSKLLPTLLLSLLLNSGLTLPGRAAAQSQIETKDVSTTSGQKKYQALLKAAETSFQKENYGDTEKLLRNCSELLPSIKLNAAERNKQSLLLLIYQAEALYRQEHYEEAAHLFEQALAGLADQTDEQGLDYSTNKLLLSSLSGCYLHLHQYDKAEPVLRAMAILDKHFCGDSDLTYGWSLLTLSEVLKALGKQQDARDFYSKAIWTFRLDNRDRIARSLGISPEQLATSSKTDAPAVYAEKCQLLEKLTEDIFGNAFKNRDKDKNLEPEGLQLGRLFDHCQARSSTEEMGGWHLQPQHFTEAPGWVWSDPRTEQKAMLVCVPGLGLHHKAYRSFAERIAREGFIVVSFDVRGFGVFTQSKGQEKLDMKGCVNDLINVLHELKNDYPKIPIFLLGESMGGALALRVAAQAPESIDGLVCSVPANARHRETGTKLQVAMKLIANNHKTMDIGKKVVNQSTADPAARSEWVEDPSSRLRLTPQELLQFELFMRQNKEVARRIDKTPVLVFQGNQDRLVKKEGTYDLFEALKTTDKAMVLLGNREHLIFEANPFKDDITMGVVGWLNAHASRCREETD